MANTVTPEQLGEALEQELTLYHKTAIERVNAVGRESMDKLVEMTKATAPAGKRGKFRRSITSQEKRAARGAVRYIWGVKPPDHRLTHLLVHGHAAKDGGRVPGNPFLQNALDVVLPEYEQAVKEALKND